MSEHRVGRLRHGLHAGHLQPARDGRALDPGHDREARRARLPGVHPDDPVLDRLPGPRPAHRQAVRPHPQDEPLQVRDEGLPRLPRARERGAPRSSTTRRRSARRRRATTGSTRSTRSARPRSTRRSSRRSSSAGCRSTTRRRSPTSARASTRRTATARSSRRVAGDFPRFVNKDPDLAPTLHKLRSAGKKLFLLTNSRWAYTDKMMTYLLDGEMSEYPHWRNYFDVVIVAATKPAFFQERRPLMERDGEKRRARRRSRSSAARSTRAATCTTSSARSASSGDEVLYVGDHIYGDILRSKKESAWRTAMIIQELEGEVARPRVVPRGLRARRAARGRARPPRGRAPLLPGAVQGALAPASTTRTTKPERRRRRRRRRGRARLRIKRAIDRVRGRLRQSTRELADDRAARRPALPPVLGVAPQGGERAVELRRAGRGVRVPLHVARQRTSSSTRRSSTSAARATRWRTSSAVTRP